MRTVMPVFKYFYIREHKAGNERNLYLNPDPSLINWPTLNPSSVYNWNNSYFARLLLGIRMM